MSDSRTPPSPHGQTSAAVRDELLESFEAALAEEDLTDAAAVLAKLAVACKADDSELAYAKARLCWAKEGAEAAQPLLARVVELDDSHADAHYDLGCLAQDLGAADKSLQHFLRVRTLDALLDKLHGLGTPEEFDAIERVAREVLEELPEPFGSRLAKVPVLIERRPARDLVEEGFDPRAFGLFEGPTDAMPGTPEPTRIVIFACNLLAAFPDDEDLCEQVEITLLHEVGHFFGLDEDDMERLGLD